MTQCICDVLGRLVRGCPVHAPGDHGTPESVHVMLLRILQNQEKIMTGIDDLKASDTSLQAAVSKLLTDYAAALTAAQGDPAAIEGVVTDMNNMAAQLNAADAALSPPAAGTGPATGTTNSTATPAG